MRIITCDVCGEQYEPTDDMIEMIVPASFIEEEGAGLRLDICGWPCVTGMVDSILGNLNNSTPDAFDEEEEGEEEAKPEKFVVIPKTPTINVDMDPKALAKFTEQATGVKRRS